MQVRLVGVLDANMIVCNLRGHERQEPTVEKINVSDPSELQRSTDRTTDQTYSIRVALIDPARKVRQSILL